MIKAGSVVSSIALLHCAVGVALAWQPLRAILADGAIGAVDPHLDRMAAFWFMFFGFLLLLLGEALRLWEGSAKLPARVGYGLLALCGTGALIMPISGFWLGVVPAALILRRARVAGTARAA
jgi:hypothetical protein